MALSQNSPFAAYGCRSSQLLCRKLSFAELYTLPYNMASLFLDAAQILSRTARQQPTPVLKNVTFVVFRALYICGWGKEWPSEVTKK